jgi:ketosteroid isomerase-like protein
VTDAEKRALCRAFFDAVVSGDVATIERVLAPEMVSWQNARGTETPRDVLLRRIGGIAAAGNGFHYEDIVCEATSDGFVERHTACLTSPEGKPVRIPAVVVGLIKDGRITRIDEYIDSAAAPR